MVVTSLHIKNMVCNRCIRVVREELEKMNMGIESVELGKVVLSIEPSAAELEQIKKRLSENGFEFLESKKAQIVERIKTLVIEFVQGELQQALEMNLSVYLSKQLNRDYHYLSGLFSSIESCTIEKFVILQKTEKVKEWLVYSDFTLSEMAYKLGYSSVAHLSHQFKQTTGLTASQFKKSKSHSRLPLDHVLTR
jgi:AraC family transcriptional regulator